MDSDETLEIDDGIEAFDLTPEEARVLGCLIEKEKTTPDQYPMTLNGVVVACNQKSNRTPVVTYDEGLVERTLRSLTDRGIARMVHKPGDRVVKYKHVADEVLHLSDKQVSLLAVLLLRAEQTPGELNQRTTRYVEFASLPEVEATLDDLRQRMPPFVERLERLPGQKENRFRELLSAPAPGADVREPLPSAPVASPAEAAAPAPAPPALAPPARARETPEPGGSGLDSLRAEVAELKARFEKLLATLGEDDI